MSSSSPISSPPIRWTSAQWSESGLLLRNKVLWQLGSAMVTVVEAPGAQQQPPSAAELGDFKVCPIGDHYQPEVDWRDMSNEELARSKEIFSKEFAELSFNHRVLHNALETKNPLLERLKFCCIVSSNLDEVYAKRLGNIPKFNEDDRADRTKNLKKIIRPKSAFEEKLAAAVRHTVELQYHCLMTDILPQLEQLGGLRVITRAMLTDEQRRVTSALFKRRILPILTPLSVDQTHPFPLLQSHGIYLMVLVRNPETLKTRHVYLRVPAVKPRTVPVDGVGLLYITVEEIVLDNFHLVCEGMEVLESYVFRVTRNVKLVIDDTLFGESDNLLDFVWEEVHQRRSAPATRLEVPQDMPQNIVEQLMRELLLDDTDVFTLPGALVGLADFMSICFSAPLPKFRDAPHVAKVPKRLEGLEDKLQQEPGRLFAQIRRQDLLVEYPKHSFQHSSTLFLRAAAQDPKVRVIKCCLYRGGADSPLVASLIRAAKAGKEVSVLVELKASFDEVQNSEYARKLQRSGCNVSYGLLGLKAHCKLLLVVREEDTLFRPYVNIATGNFNPGTAKLYTDQSLFTSREDICADVVDLYNALFGYSRKRSYRRLLVAPVNMLSAFVSFLRREAEHARSGLRARIIAQVNGLTEPEIVQELYAASQAGVEIDLIVRGVCALRPGLEGKSDNIRVYSWIGRFLQHQRIFYMYNNGNEQMYIGSADWRSRNLNDRIEVCCPILDPKLRKRLQLRLMALLSDQQHTWHLASDGRYYFRTRPSSSAPRRLQLVPSAAIEDFEPPSVLRVDDDAEGGLKHLQVTINSQPVLVHSVVHVCVPVRLMDGGELQLLMITKMEKNRCAVDNGGAADGSAAAAPAAGGGEAKAAASPPPPPNPSAPPTRSWTFPLGDSVEGETLVDAMKRKVEEESGVSGVVVDHLNLLQYSERGVADVYVLRVDAEQEWPAEFVRERRWLSLKDALAPSPALRSANMDRAGRTEGLDIGWRRNLLAVAAS